jgi:putative tryptophan/tyrosine transport system substrate-binding protein
MPERRRALELLAKSRHGANEELLVHGHGFRRPMLVGLVRSGLASAEREVMKAGDKAIEIVRAVDKFAAEPNGGLIVVLIPSAAELDAILQLTLQYRLPAIYLGSSVPALGGLMSYGADATDFYWLAASYVDRLLRGAKVNELPLQFATKLRLVLNLKAAERIGLTIPEPILLRADKLIQ